MNEPCLGTDLTSSEWAAWVQAIGTIMALFIAIGVVWLQQYWSAKAEREKYGAEHISRFHSIYAIARVAASLIGEAHDALHSGNGARYMAKYNQSAFIRSGSALDRIQLHEIGSAPIVDCLLRLLAALGQSQQHLDWVMIQFQRGVANLTPYSSDIRWEDARSALEDLEKLIEREAVGLRQMMRADFE